MTAVEREAEELYRAATRGYTGVGPRREPRCWEDQGMRLQHQWWSGLVAAVLGGLVGVTAVAAAGEQFLPVLGVREGARGLLGSRVSMATLPI